MHRMELQTAVSNSTNYKLSALKRCKNANAVIHLNQILYMGTIGQRLCGKTLYKIFRATKSGLVNQ